MKRLVTFLGESGSGKTTLIHCLTTLYPDQFKKVVTCTSRPMRPGERDGVDYHFMPPEFFVNNPHLVLAKQTSEGFHYGTRRADLSSPMHHLLLTSKPTGVSKLLALCGQNVMAVRITISESMKIERMRARGDSEDAIRRRLLTDAADHIHVDLGPVPTLELHAAQAVEHNVQRVLEFVNR